MYKPQQKEKPTYFEMIEPHLFNAEEASEKEKEDGYSNDVLYSASLVQELSERYHHGMQPAYDPYGMIYADTANHHHGMISSYGHPLPQYLPSQPRLPDLKIQQKEVAEPERKRKSKKAKPKHLPEKEEPIDCDECGKQFKTKSSFFSHRKTHFQIREHTCPICSMTFSRNHGICRLFTIDMKRHEMVHSEDKPFRCPSCGRGFSRRDALKRHVNAMQKKEGGCQAMKQR